MYYRVSKLREENEIKKREMARIIGVSESCYNHYECERDIMPLKHINTLSNYFNVSIDYIFNLTSIRKYSNEMTDIDRKKVGLRIKEFRKENKLTQIKLASILNIANGTIAEYERGTNLIATPFLYTICKNYNISADYLLGKVDEPKYITKKDIS